MNRRKFFVVSTATGLALQYSLILIGAAVLLATLNVSRGLLLFGVAFVATLLVLGPR